jgi:hypothetical protein
MALEHIIPITTHVDKLNSQLIIKILIFSN